MKHGCNTLTGVLGIGAPVYFKICAIFGAGNTEHGLLDESSQEIFQGLRLSPTQKTTVDLLADMFQINLKLPLPESSSPKVTGFHSYQPPKPPKSSPVDPGLQEVMQVNWAHPRRRFMHSWNVLLSKFYKKLSSWQRSRSCWSNILKLCAFQPTLLYCSTSLWVLLVWVHLDMVVAWSCSAQ